MLHVRKIIFEEKQSGLKDIVKKTFYSVCIQKQICPNQIMDKFKTLYTHLIILEM